MKAGDPLLYLSSTTLASLDVSTDDVVAAIEGLLKGRAINEIVSKDLVAPFSAPLVDTKVFYGYEHEHAAPSRSHVRAQTCLRKLACANLPALVVC